MHVNWDACVAETVLHPELGYHVLIKLVHTYFGMTHIPATGLLQTGLNGCIAHMWTTLVTC